MIYFIRLLFIATISYIAKVFFSRVISNLLAKPKNEENNNSRLMVKCNYCDIYFIPHDGIKYKNKFYCCQEHIKKENKIS